MIFQHTWEKVLSGEKTQTRRIAKGNCRYEVGKTYAIQPAYGKKAIGRIEVVNVRHEDVRFISYKDIEAEGFKTYSEFMQTWCFMHDKPMLQGMMSDDVLQSWLISYGDETRYKAYVIEFKVIQ